MRLFRRLSYRSALTAALATRLVPVLARDAARATPRAAARSLPAGSRSPAQRWQAPSNGQSTSRRRSSCAAMRWRSDRAGRGRGRGTTCAWGPPRWRSPRLRSRGDRERRGQWRPTRVWSWPWGLRSSRCRRRSSCWPPLPSPGRGRAWGWRVPDPLALAERFTYTYPEADRPALRELSLAFEPGTFTVVSGLSGSGKSTLLRAPRGGPGPALPRRAARRRAGGGGTASATTAPASLRPSAGRCSRIPSARW